jgi:hypothetical protein
VLGIDDWGSLLLIVLIALIGPGSSLFHTMATPLAAMADVLPILIFQIVYLWLFSDQLIPLGLPGKLILISAFFIASVLVGLGHRCSMVQSLIFPRFFS